MRSLIVFGTFASLLTLAACNRETETAAPADEATAASDAAADTASTSAAPGAGYGGGAAPGDTATPYPANEPAPPAAADGDSPISDATRAGAKEKAETTNLHPKTN